MLTNKADVNIQDHDGNAALHHAAVSGLQDIIHILIASKNIKLNVQNKVFTFNKQYNYGCILTYVY